MIVSAHSGGKPWGDPDLPDCTPEEAVAAVKAVRHDRCPVCGRTEYANDQGLGRATLAAWQSRHGRNCDGK